MILVFSFVAILLVGLISGYFLGKEMGREGYRKITDKEWIAENQRKLEDTDDEMFESWSK